MDTIDYNKLTVVQLKEKLKDLGVKGYSKLKKNELIELFLKEKNYNFNKKILLKNKEILKEDCIEKKSENNDPLNILDITNDFNTKIASVKVAYLRTIGYKSFEEWLKGVENFYVGRNGRIFIGSGENKKVFYYPASIFGNPFVLRSNVKAEDDIDICLQKYYDYVKNNKELYNNLDSIKNKTIGCWCGINDKCHAKVLIKLLKEKSEAEKKIKN